MFVLLAANGVLVSCDIYEVPKGSNWIVTGRVDPNHISPLCSFSCFNAIGDQSLPLFNRTVGLFRCFFRFDNGNDYWVYNSSSKTITISEWRPHHPEATYCLDNLNITTPYEGDFGNRNDGFNYPFKVTNCTGKNTQQWILESDGTIRSGITSSDGKALYLQASLQSDYRAMTPLNLGLASNASGKHVRFTFIPVPTNGTLLSALMVKIPSPGQGSNLVSNGGFEVTAPQNTSTSGDKFLIYPGEGDLCYWSVGSKYQTNDRADVAKGNAKAGSNSLVLGDPENTGYTTLTQFIRTRPDNNYNLSFDLAGSSESCDELYTKIIRVEISPSTNSSMSEETNLSFINPMNDRNCFPLIDNVAVVHDNFIKTRQKLSQVAQIAEGSNWIATGHFDPNHISPLCSRSCFRAIGNDSDQLFNRTVGLYRCYFSFFALDDYWVYNNLSKAITVSEWGRNRPNATYCLDNLNITTAFTTDVKDASTFPFRVRNCTGEKSQQWFLQDDGRIRSAIQSPNGEALYLQAAFYSNSEGMRPLVLGSASDEAGKYVQFTWIPVPTNGSLLSAVTAGHHSFSWRWIKSRFQWCRGLAPDYQHSEFERDWQRGFQQFATRRFWEYRSSYDNPAYPHSSRQQLFSFVFLSWLVRINDVSWDLISLNFTALSEATNLTFINRMSWKSCAPLIDNVTVIDEHMVSKVQGRESGHENTAGRNKISVPTIVALVIGICAVTVIAGLTAALFIFFPTKRAALINILKKTRSNIQLASGQWKPTENDMPYEDALDNICTYTMQELAIATDNFTTKVGEGGFGTVYRACLADKRIGAVKRATRSRKQDPAVFNEELSLLLRVRHPYLAPKSCIATVLVKVLYSKLTEQYLHEEAKPTIVHWDIKSSNVLLVDDNQGKLADFGLSKLGPKENQATFTAVKGSYGYTDPQYIKTGKLSVKSDVYSFSVFLLELITGLKSVQGMLTLAESTGPNRLSDDINIVAKIVDPKLHGQFDLKELENTVKIANLCVLEKRELRPCMRQIVSAMRSGRCIFPVPPKWSDDGTNTDASTSSSSYERGVLEDKSSNSCVGRSISTMFTFHRTSKLFFSLPPVLWRFMYIMARWSFIWVLLPA
eukprot:Gb_24069 [translate_table: standard]